MRLYRFVSKYCLVLKKHSDKIFVITLLNCLACGGGGGGTSTEPTEPPDTTPDIFVFDNQTTTQLTTLVESETITITGINEPADISISGGEYQTQSGNFTNTTGSISDGQSIKVRVLSADSIGTTTSATLTIGGVSASFSVTTLSQTPIIDRISNTSCIAPARPNSGEVELELQAAFQNLPALGSLVGLFQPPEDTSRWYAMLQNGQVYWFDNDSNADNLNLYIDLSAKVDFSGESGLLGMAFHPKFSSNGEIYFSYVNNNSESIISRITSQGTTPIDSSNEQVLLTLRQPAGNHNGGHILFGPDDYLYIGFGDGGGSNDTFGHGQNTQSLHSTLLRIDVSGTSYSIPPDNPFVNNGAVLDEIYAYGLRNPWRWSFDRQSNELWLGDVGQNEIEEIDIVTPGANLGWPITEGSNCFQQNNCDTTGLTLPVAEYDHSGGDCSVTGGFVYRGQQIPTLQGSYLFADFCSGRIRSATRQVDQTYLSRELLLTGMSISSFAQDADGEVYVLNHSGGVGQGVFRFVNSSISNDNIPDKLSQTGCYKSTSEKNLSDGVVNYSVTSELWSDNADKTRAFAIPDNARIDVLSDGDFDFPEGTILIKNFLQNGQHLETRLYMRHVTGWAGYSYRWLDDQSDAVLVAGNEIEIVSGENFEHIIPTRGQCFECHTGAATISLGLEASQLDFSIDYPNGNNGNQLLALFGASYLTSLPISDQVTPLAAIDDESASLELRARSYLHSNCSNCHRPGGPNALMDFRAQTSLAQTNACDQTPINGDLGINDARIIAPGNSPRSILVTRMQSLQSSERMPPLATQLVDQQAVDVVSQWIDSLSGCN